MEHQQILVEAGVVREAAGYWVGCCSRLKRSIALRSACPVRFQAIERRSFGSVTLILTSSDGYTSIVLSMP